MAIKFFNDVAVDSDVLYVDTANNEVGINTNNPTAVLHVTRSSGSVPLFQVDDVGDKYFQVLPDSNTTFLIGDLDALGGGIYIKGEFSNIQFIQDGNELIRIKDNGNVGIGATNPDRKLVIEGGGFSMFADGGTSTDIFSVVTHQYTFSDENEDAVYSYNGTDGHEFSTGGSPRVNIKQTGKVGVGTTNPHGLLSSQQGQQTGNVFTNPNLALQSSTAADGGFCGMTFAASSAVNYGYSVGAHRTSAAHSDFEINYHYNDAAGTNRFIIDQTGNVGIGTPSPGELLHIKGSTTTTAMEIESSVGGNTILKFNNDGGGSGSSGGQSHIFFGTYNTFPVGDDPDRGRISYYHNLSSGTGIDYMTFTTNNAEKVRIQGNGNVGINSTSPQERLVVSGNTSITNNLYVGSGNTLTSCTYPAQQSLIVGKNNTLGGIANGIIGVGNIIDCTAEPWLNFGGNFIAGINNIIYNQYTHANAVFGQGNILGDPGSSTNNIANSLIAGSEHTLFSNNALVYGYDCFSSNASYSLVGGYDSNNFGGFGSVAIGAGATASAGNNQYAFGAGVTTPTTASAAYGADQFVVGKFNEYTNASSVPHRFAVGNGASDASRNTPFCVIGGGTYTNGQVSINDADGYSYTSIPYSVFHVNGRATSSYSSTFTTTSDERVKKNIVDYSKGLAEIIQVQPKSYAFNGKGNTIEDVESIGVLAQEIKEVFPETVGTVNKKLNPEDEQETELYTVDISPVTYALINAVKELNAKVEALEARIQTLEGN